MIKELAFIWITWRHGNLYAIKPPIGFPPFQYPKWYRLARIRYEIRRILWKLESFVHEKYCGEMREQWRQKTIDDVLDEIGKR